jgi:hypothetical protein
VNAHALAISSDGSHKARSDAVAPKANRFGITEINPRRIDRYAIDSKTKMMAAAKARL